MSIHLRGRDGLVATIELHGDGRAWTVTCDATSFPAEILEHQGTRITFQIADRVHLAHVCIREREVRVIVEGREVIFQRVAHGGMSAAAHGAAAEPVLRAPVPGRILKLNATAGQRVRAGDILAVIEAMKMETPIVAPAEGTVLEVHVTANASIDQDQPIITCTYEDTSRNR